VDKPWNRNDIIAITAGITAAAWNGAGNIPAKTTRGAAPVIKGGGKDAHTLQERSRDSAPGAAAGQALE